MMLVKFGMDMHSLKTKLITTTKHNVVKPEVESEDRTLKVQGGQGEVLVNIFAPPKYTPTQHHRQQNPWCPTMLEGGPFL